MRALHGSVVALAMLVVAGAGRADDAYYDVPLSTLKITSGTLPKQSTPYSTISAAMRPYAALDVPGEVYVAYQRYIENDLERTRVCARVKESAGKDVTGRLYLLKEDSSGLTQIKFTLPANAAKRDAREAFLKAKLTTNEELLNGGGPGAAWFRHQVRDVHRELGDKKQENNQFAPRSSDGPFDEYALFTGGRAISENIQLDRVLLLRTDEDKKLVDISTIAGITVKEIDWTKLTKDLKPTLDPLAKRIPSDQHVVFFPSFEAFIRVADEAEHNGTPVLQLAEPKAEDAKTVERYQKQLCLSLSGLGRKLGPVLAKSVALTGSDVNFRTGTDLAVLFESTQPEILQGLLVTQVKAVSAGTKDAKPVQGTIGDVAYEGARSPDRTVSCYVAKIDDVVVVTNSLHQLERLAAVHAKKSPALSSLPEYTFFRDRYRLGDKDEAALLFLSDATIRRWCGPRWRIAGARQLLDLGVMTELQATYIDQIAAKTLQPGPVHTDMRMATPGDLRLDVAGVHSKTVGSLEFLTPIAEIPLSEVTKSEADAYERWRRGYETNWQWAFDPIALRLSVQGNKLGADLTVMPLIWGSQYRDEIAISQGAEIKPGKGDPHDAIAHYVMSLNHKSDQLRQATNLFSAMTGGQAKIDPLSWIGGAYAVYLDEDPVWEKLAKVDFDKSEQVMPLLIKLPVALWVEVGSPLKATLFLAGVRAFIEQTAPNMTNWESLKHKEKPYVKISAGKEFNEQSLKDLAIYYSISGEALIVSLNEQVIQRAIEREAERKAAKPGADAKPPHVWLGSNMAFEADQRLTAIVMPALRKQYQESMQLLAWRNLPILNEWKRRYPDRDPVEVHEQVWKIRLICPGGGKYVWNDEWQTMESTVYGHPGVSKSGPAAPAGLTSLVKGRFGLVFEEQGLRGRVELERKAPGK